MCRQYLKQYELWLPVRIFIGRISLRHSLKNSHKAFSDKNGLPQLANCNYYPSCSSTYVDNVNQTHVSYIFLQQI